MNNETVCGHPNCGTPLDESLVCDECGEDRDNNAHDADPEFGHPFRPRPLEERHPAGAILIDETPLASKKFRAVGNTLYITLGEGKPPEYLVFYSQSDDVARIAGRHNEVVTEAAVEIERLETKADEWMEKWVRSQGRAERAEADYKEKLAESDDYRNRWLDLRTALRDTLSMINSVVDAVDTGAQFQSYADIIRRQIARGEAALGDDE